MSVTTPVKKHFYFDIFHKDFNLAFHKPKKNMCDLCVKYSRSSDTEKDEMRQRMEEHLKNKTVCREQEKPRAQSDSKVNVACFDLQQVLITPHSMSSQLYYRRKLATYNLTVFDVAKKDGYYYMWHEGRQREEQAVRDTPQDSTGFTPFELLYGYQVRTTMTLLKRLWTGDNEDPEVKT